MDWAELLPGRPAADCLRRWKMMEKLTKRGCTFGAAVQELVGRNMPQLLEEGGEEAASGQKSAGEDGVAEGGEPGAHLKARRGGKAEHTLRQRHAGGEEEHEGRHQQPGETEEAVARDSTRKEKSKRRVRPSTGRI